LNRSIVPGEVETEGQICIVLVYVPSARLTSTTIGKASARKKVDFRDSVDHAEAQLWNLRLDANGMG
jgi:hypothetical protein